MELDENLHKLKRKCVQQDDYQVSCNSFDDRLCKLEAVRMTQKQWATKAYLKKQAYELDQSMETQVKANIIKSLQTNSDLVRTLHAHIDDKLHHLMDITAKHETVVDELNNAFEILSSAALSIKRLKQC
jgi:hypothetical protein